MRNCYIGVVAIAKELYVAIAIAKTFKIAL